ncbi:MAG: hypothetical protein EOP37_07245 [Rubrivivax sp.]|nr:MAG: hypothetical protein EOP37_07245 [Rubrivivax sp.]
MITTMPVSHFAAPNGDLYATCGADTDTYSHLRAAKHSPVEHVYGMASCRSHLNLALGGANRPLPKRPSRRSDYEQVGPPSSYEQVDLPQNWTKARGLYANRALPALPPRKPDGDANYETIAPAKPMRAREFEPAPHQAPTSLQSQSQVYFELEPMQPRKTPPATPPKPVSTSLAPRTAGIANSGLASAQIPSGIAAEAAAIARQRAGV